MTVLLLFVSCFARFNHFHVEVQGLACQRVVGIDGDGFVAYFHDTNDLGATRSLCLELHARLDGVDTFKRRTWDRLDQFFVDFAVTFTRLNRYFHLIASVLFVQRIFQSADNVLSTFQIGQRLATFYTEESSSSPWSLVSV